MGDACVVCGEVVEGKPLYKKLGSGEYNVEVLTALRALQLTIITEDDKKDGYICWDCDEVLVAEYGRYLESEESKRVEEVKHKGTKKQRKSKIESKKKKQVEIKIKSKPPEIHKGKKIGKLKLSLSRINSESATVTKIKKSEHKRPRKPSKAYHSTHCVMCDKSFENGDKGYQCFNLKKMVNDDLDIAEVMQILGLARHIAPEMKKKRFVCNPCYYIIRRNYKNKLSKGTSIEGAAPGGPVNKPSNQNPIHRATTQEHAAEIAKLLPPALAECYKILTGDSDMKEKEITPVVDTSQQQSSAVDVIKDSKMRREQLGIVAGRNDLLSQTDVDDQSAGTEAEDEDSGFNVSQDEYGNYVISVDELDSPYFGNEGMEKTKTLVTALPKDNRLSNPSKKKNVLLPKRRQHHLSIDQDSESSLPESDSHSSPQKATSPTNSEDCSLAGVCNICGIRFTGKAPTWWYSLESRLAGFENITVTIALRLLETSLADTSEEARIARQVCPMCYGMVSAGFRSQVTQRVEKQLHVDPSQVHISKMKVQTVPKEKLKSDYGQQRSVNGDIAKVQGLKRKMIDNHIRSGDGKKSKDVDRKSGSPLSQISIKRGRKRKKLLSKAQSNADIEQPPPRNESPDNDGVKTPKPIVLLEDLRSILPAEAFGGKAVSALKIEGDISQNSPAHSVEESCYTDLLLPSTYPQPSRLTAGLPTASQDVHSKEISSETDNGDNVKTNNQKIENIRGRCVVCGCNYSVEPDFWQNIDDMIQPPSLMISVRWVCISLNVTPVEVSPHDQNLGRVCKYCFGRLSKQFVNFVKTKVGESCGIAAGDVKLKDYTITFNPNTMNIEADPLSVPKSEKEELSNLLKRIVPVIESCSLDDLVHNTRRQPLVLQEFSIWMLLVLNDFRVQIGAAIGDLANWLTELMPNELFNRGLRPCQNKLASFLLTLSRISNNMDCEEMKQMIPEDIFVTVDVAKPSTKEVIIKDISEKRDSPEKVDGGCASLKDHGKNSDSKYDQANIGDDMSGKAEIHWEDFLRQTSLDELMEGSAKPLSFAQFSNGVIYALWRTSVMIGDGTETFRGWLKQISPILLDHLQSEEIIDRVKSLHDHLEKHPEDVCKLGIQVIPFLRPGMTHRLDEQLHEALPTATISDQDISDFNILGSDSRIIGRQVQNSRSDDNSRRKSPSLISAQSNKLKDKISVSSESNVEDPPAGTTNSPSKSAADKSKQKKLTKGSPIKQTLQTPGKASSEISKSKQSHKAMSRVFETVKEKNSMSNVDVSKRINSNHVGHGDNSDVALKIASHVKSTKIETSKKVRNKKLRFPAKSGKNNKATKHSTDKSSQSPRKIQNSSPCTTLSDDSKKSKSTNLQKTANSEFHLESDKGSSSSFGSCKSDTSPNKDRPSGVHSSVQELSRKFQEGKSEPNLSVSKAHVKQIVKHSTQVSPSVEIARHSGELNAKHKVRIKEIRKGSSESKGEQSTTMKIVSPPKFLETQRYPEKVAVEKSKTPKLSKSKSHTGAKVIQSARDPSGKSASPHVSANDSNSKDKMHISINKSSGGEPSGKSAGSGDTVNDLSSREKLYVTKKTKPRFEDLLNYDT